MSFLLDSNILCRLCDKNDPDHEAAKGAVRSLLQKGEDLFLIPQVEREFWVVATRPVENNGLGLIPGQAAEQLKSFRSIFKFRLDQSGVHALWRRLVFDHDVRGKAAHDAGIVAAALAQQFNAILTFNKKDFERYKTHIGVKTPVEIVGLDK